MDAWYLALMAEQLKKSNYIVNELKDFASKPKVPDDCTVLIIAASASGALLDHEIKGITDYLAAGGRALILDDPSSGSFSHKNIHPL